MARVNWPGLIEVRYAPDGTKFGRSETTLSAKGGSCP